VTTISNIPEPKRAAISIKEMAAQCALSRQRFMQLVKAEVFPVPLYDVASRRPFYSEEMQVQCLEVRKRNLGINGKVVMFYARRPGVTPATPKTKKAEAKAAYPDILDGLKALGLTTATSAQVAEAVGQLFPEGTAATDPAEVIRAVFVHLHRKDSGGNVGRK